MTESTDIRELDQTTIERIAAGEVVERPASVVKELVENSLDADASRIEVAIDEGGIDRVRIRDDGVGMSEADVRAAVRQHTTSKIRDIDDLESGVATLGFRGEALHTIGAVSRTTIRTKPRGSDGAGTELVYEGGEVASVSPVGCPEGTTIEVRDLFYNTPARRKFLKTTATEFAHVNRVVTRYALANPDVAVSLEHDGHEVFATTGQGDVRSAMLAVYGREVAKSMIPVDARAAGEGDEDGSRDSAADGPGDDESGDSDGDDAIALPDGPLTAISGHVSHPETNRSTREYVATYVNGRYVSESAIREAVVEAYDGQLGPDRYPFVVLFLTVPPDAVDVNVHPRKMEVRFDDEDAVRRQVRAAVSGALLDHGLVRTSAPRGRSAPDEATIVQGGEDGETGDGDAPSRSDDSAASATDRAEPSRSPTPTDRSSRRTDRPTSRTDRPTSRTNCTPAHAERTSSGGRSGRDQRVESAESTNSAASSPANDPADSTRHAVDDRSSAHGHDLEPERRFTKPTTQRTLDGSDAPADRARRFDSLPPLRILGQLHDTYLVCETPDGLALIDQHAADERVNYERLQGAFQRDASAQAMANPVEIELTAAEAALFDDYREALATLGFYADRTDDERTIAVTTVPAVLGETIDPERLRDVLSSFVSGDRDAGAETVESLADEFLADLACYPSITGNTSLTEGSVVDLLAALDDCENPYACPHGRPVVIHLDEDEIADRFERDYPGHAG